MISHYTNIINIVVRSVLNQGPAIVKPFASAVATTIYTLLPWLYHSQLDPSHIGPSSYCLAATTPLQLLLGAYLSSVLRCWGGEGFIVTPAIRRSAALVVLTIIYTLAIWLNHFQRDSSHTGHSSYCLAATTPWQLQLCA